MKLLFIVPAFNEAGSLPLVVNDLRTHYPAGDIAVINDGSTDGTVQVARRLGVILLDLPFNLGIGGAVQAGLLYAHRQGYEAAIQFDGDGQHRADQVSVLLEAMERQGADVVVGSRFLGQTGYQAPLLRRFGIAVFRIVNSLVTGQLITDSTSGFRLYNRSALAMLADEYPHDYPEPESVVTLCRQGFRLCEVSVQMRERQAGHSSITPARSIYYMLKVLLAIAVGASRKTARRSP